MNINMTDGKLEKSTTDTVYCHFSFRRPKGKDYGLFATAFYFDPEGKKLTAQVTRKFPLWQDHQFISAIQSYEHALFCIYQWQGIMKNNGINQVLLVTDNSTLVGWIDNPKKNKAYTKWMEKAVEKYRVGGPREIKLGVGICKARDYEKSYKFCKEEKVINNDEDSSGSVRNVGNGQTVLDLNAAGIKYQTINDIESSRLEKPDIDGITEV